MLNSSSIMSYSIINSSELPMGHSVKDGNTFFKVFSPRASEIEVFIYDDFDTEANLSAILEKLEDGNWIGVIEQDLTNKLYAYKIVPPAERTNFFIETPYLIADPWSKHVTSKNHYLQFPKTKIVPESNFDWEGDQFRAPSDPRDLIIYEAHIKDMVGHPSAQTNVQGIYNDFREARVGGINHL